MREKIRAFIDQISDFLEVVLNIILIIAVIIAIISLWKPFLDFIHNRESVHAFLTFLGYVMNILIGIEFFKMLCKPDLDTVLEVVIFVIVRHMIIAETTALENLLTIIGIAIVFSIKKFLKPSEEDKNLFHSANKKKKETLPEE